MSVHPQFSQDPSDILALRQEAGRWIKALRETAKLSQRDLAKAIGIEYYTFISQIEAGRGRVPPAQYLAFADALNVPVRDFVTTLLRFYDPVTHYALFGLSVRENSQDKLGNSVNDNGSTVAELADRIARLEDLLAMKVVQ